MGYLDNTSITVDAILTKRGRQLLASGRDKFNITKFALADDEIDYDLWNPTHPLGSSYYGEVIENMPILEAFADESQMMRSKLISLPKLSQFVPVLAIQPNVSSVTLSRTGEIFIVNPTTLNLSAGNSSYGYTAILADNTAVDLRLGTGNTIPQNTDRNSANITNPYIGDNTNSKTIAIVGNQFELVAKPQQIGTYRTTLTIFGNETGGSVVLQVTVSQLTVDVINSTNPIA